MGKTDATAMAKREIEWRQHLVRHASSGQNITTFCRNEKLAESRFYFWRDRLQGKPSVQDSPSLSATVVATAMPAAFIDLGIVTKQNASTIPVADKMPEVRPSGIEMRIDLGEGIVITIARR